MTTPLTPRGAPLNHANSTSAAALAASTPVAATTPAADSMQAPARQGAFNTPQTSFTRAGAVAAAAAAAAGGVGVGTPVGAEGGSRAMVSTPSFTSLRELWGQLSPEEVQERISLAGG
jgi:hypothetical protein